MSIWDCGIGVTQPQKKGRTNSGNKTLLKWAALLKIYESADSAARAEVIDKYIVHNNIRRDRDRPFSANVTFFPDLDE
jgi:hypothetical protein